MDSPKSGRAPRQFAARAVGLEPTVAKSPDPKSNLCRPALDRRDRFCHGHWRFQRPTRVRHGCTRLMAGGLEGCRNLGQILGEFVARGHLCRRPELPALLSTGRPLRASSVRSRMIVYGPSLGCRLRHHALMDRQRKGSPPYGLLVCAWSFSVFPSPLSIRVGVSKLVSRWPCLGSIRNN